MAKESKEKDARIHVAVFLDKETIAQVDAWAEKFGISRSKMAASLVEGCIENEGLLISVAANTIAAARFIKEKFNVNIDTDGLKAKARARA